MKKATIKYATSLFVMMLLAIGFTANSFAQYTFYGDDVIIDGDFAGDSISSAWSTFEANWDGGPGASATFANVNGEAAITDIVSDGSQPWYIQFNQDLTEEQIKSLISGEVYELSFDARTDADSTRGLRVYFGQNAEPYANYAESVELTGTMTTFTQDVLIAEVFDTTQGGMKLGFEMGLSEASVYLDNISLKRKSESILKEGGLIVGDTLSGEWIYEGNGTNANFTPDNGMLKIADIASGINSYDVQVRQELNTEQIDSIYPGPYEISFDAKTNVAEKNIQVFVGNNGTDGDWTNFAPVVTITDEMTHYAVAIEALQNWSQMKVGFEVSGDTSPVWLDNVVLKRVREVAPDAPLVTLTTTDGIVTIEVTPVDGAASYDVFFADTAFTDRDGGQYVGTIDPATGYTLEHTTKAPHPSVAFDFEAFYGVTANTESGTASELATGSIETSMSSAENYAYELSDDAFNAAATAFSNEEIPAASALASFFPDGYTPFTIDERQGNILIGADVLDEDLSSKHWVGFTTQDQPYLLIYAEVMDDSVVYATEADGSGGAWNFDSWEMGLGNYTPDSFIEGSTHSAGIGGAQPDWQLRGGGLVNAAGDGSERGFVHGYGYTAERINGEVPNSETLIEKTDYGYRTLTLLAVSNLVSGDDAAFEFPTGTEVGLYPFQIALNDNDATARDVQKGWGPRAVNGDWWQRPAQWEVVAFVGADAEVPTSNEEVENENPASFSLEQNYPNPFNPSTNINFTLPTASKVTLEVFNMLGQKVATLIQNESLTAGTHTHSFDASNLASGLYIYRINAGSSFTSAKKMMLIK